LDATNIPNHICIASRLLKLPNDQNIFSFGMLPIERTEAEEILAYLSQVRTEMLETAQTEVQDHEAEDIEAAITEELTDVMFHETLTAWIGQGFEN
jgi:hypothetical protein